ncbi:MAG: lipopolysaccharide heptosyltransferase family protein [Aquifex sp.]|nr:MAG: lipopolysaccharide heptosyltransferase family protein [Aquifex sp.]
MKKALLYRRGGLGDTLLTFPILEILKRKGYETVAVGNTDYFIIAKEAGYADRVYSFIPEEEFDLKVIISLDGNVKPFPENREWIVKHYLKTLKMEEDFTKELPIKPLQNSPLRGKVVVHPSSGSKKKNPPIEFFLKLRDFLESKGKEVVFLLGEAEENLKETLKPNFFSLSPLEIAKHLKTAEIYIGLDSGISHLASYLGLPSFVIYGPTDPIVWKPIGNRVFQISLNLECSPCFPEVCDERPCLNTEEILKRTKEMILRYWEVF